MKNGNIINYQIVIFRTIYLDSWNLNTVTAEITYEAAAVLKGITTSSGYLARMKTIAIKEIRWLQCCVSYSYISAYYAGNWNLNTVTAEITYEAAAVLKGITTSSGYCATE